MRGRRPCPCCLYWTLHDPFPGSYEICPICNWEDDGVQFRDPSAAGGANQPCLVDARRSFDATGSSEGRRQARCRAPTVDEGPRVNLHTAPHIEKLGNWPLTWWLPQGSAAQPPQVVHLRAGITTTADLFDGLAEALSFPSYFGHNWNAVDECMTDLSWISADHIHLHHSDWPGVAAKDSQLYLEVLADSVVATRYRSGALLSVSVPDPIARKPGEPKPR